MREELDVRHWAAEVWPGYDWSGADVRHGAFHQVALADDVVARVAFGRTAAQRTGRQEMILRAVATVDLPVPVPRLVAPAVVAGQGAGLLMTCVPGGSTEAAWPELRDGFASLLAAFGDVEEVALPPARSWCGGEQWLQILSEDLAPVLRSGGADSDRAVQLADDAIGVSAGVAQRFVHGDFGPHNVLWTAGEPSGLIDLDHLTWADPALDLATLIGFYGADAVAQIADQDILTRAMRHRATLSLQVAAAAHLNGDTLLRDFALGNFTARAEQGTLYDPGGGTPNNV